MVLNFITLDMLFASIAVGGAYTSSDGGRSWDWISGSMPGTTTWNTQCLAPDPSDPTGQTIIIGHGSPSDNTTTRPWDQQGISRTTDGGKTWELVLPGVIFDGNADWRQGGECIAFDPSSPTTVWAGTMYGLWKSDKAGAPGSWAPVDSFNSNPSVFNKTVGGLAGISFRGTLEQPDLGAHSSHEAEQKLLSRGGAPLGAPSQEVWVVGPGTVAISLNGGSTWKSASEFGNASSLNIVGGLRSRRCLNGTTFISVEVS